MFHWSELLPMLLGLLFLSACWRVAEKAGFSGGVQILLAIFFPIGVFVLAATKWPIEEQFDELKRKRRTIELELDAARRRLQGATDS